MVLKELPHNGCDLLPIDFLVFFKSSSNTILKCQPGDSTDLSKVCKARDIFNKIRAIEKRFQKERISNQALKQIGISLCVF